MGYRPKHFQLQELVSQYAYSTVDHQKLWHCFDDRILITADRMREEFGECYVNNWYWDGKLMDCGFRMVDSNTGTAYSQHRFGRALDLHFKKNSAITIRLAILGTPTAFPFEFITCIEDDVSWVHVDCRNHAYPQKILVVKP